MLKYIVYFILLQELICKYKIGNFLNPILKAIRHNIYYPSALLSYRVFFYFKSFKLQ